MALGVPQGAPFLAAHALVHLTSSTAIGIWLVAVGAVVTEAAVVWAVLPANWTNTRVSILTVGVAESAILLLVIWARGERLASSAAVGLLPARVGHISVVIVVMEVVDRCTVVVLLSVSKWLLRVLSEVRHVFLVLVVAVEALVSHWVLIDSMDSSVVHRRVVEVLRVVVGVVMTVLHLMMGVMHVSEVVLCHVLWVMQVCIKRQVVMDVVVTQLVMDLVHVLDVKIIMDNFVMNDSLVLVQRLCLLLSLGTWLCGIRVSDFIRVVLPVWVVSIVAVIVSIGISIGVGVVSVIAWPIEDLMAAILDFMSSVDSMIRESVSHFRVLCLLGLVILVVVSVVFLRFVVSWIPVSSVASVVVGVSISLNNGVVRWVGVLISVGMNWDALNVVIVVPVMVRVGWADLLWVSVVVSALGDDVVGLWSSDGEVERLVLLVFVVVSVILVTVDVLRGHMVMKRIHVMARGNFVSSALVGDMSGWIISLVGGSHDLSVLCQNSVSSAVVNWGLMDDSSVVRGDMVHWSLVNHSCMVRGYMVHRGLMDNGCVVRGSMVHWSLVNHSSVVRGSMVHWSLVNHSCMVRGSMVHWDRVMNWNSVVNRGLMNDSCVVRSNVMDRGLMNDGGVMRSLVVSDNS